MREGGATQQEWIRAQQRPFMEAGPRSQGAATSWLCVLCTFVCTKSASDARFGATGPTGPAVHLVTHPGRQSFRRSIIEARRNVAVTRPLRRHLCRETELLWPTGCGASLNSKVLHRNGVSFEKSFDENEEEGISAARADSIERVI